MTLKLNKFDNKFKKKYCNNCGKIGHLHKHCQEPVTSIGIIGVKLNFDNICIEQLKNKLCNIKQNSSIMTNNIGIKIDSIVDSELFSLFKENIKILMIRRRFTLGFIEFMRGRYKIENINGTSYLFKQMIKEEIELIKNNDFDTLWNLLWENNNVDVDDYIEQIKNTNNEKNITNDDLSEKINNVAPNNNEQENTSENNVSSDNASTDNNEQENTIENNVDKINTNNIDLKDINVINDTVLTEDNKIEKNKTTQNITDIIIDSNDVSENKNDKFFWKNSEYAHAKKKFDYIKDIDNAININTILENINLIWSEPEWGFPKGRRNCRENNIKCAIREFTEETDFTINDYVVFDNILPFEENFIGTNGIMYRHVYYLAFISTSKNVELNTKNKMQSQEIGAIGLFNFDEACKLIRPYHIARLEILGKLLLFIINNLITIYHE